MVGTWKAITSRAFASLADFTHLTMHLLASDGRWLAMKGVVPEDEIAALPSNVKVLAIEKLVVPGLEEERHLIVLGKELWGLFYMHSQRCFLSLTRLAERCSL